MNIYYMNDCLLFTYCIFFSVYRIKTCKQTSFLLFTSVYIDIFFSI
nr:MAG TPA: hypothetical protein [Caudoviricetes sp.]